MKKSLLLLTALISLFYYSKNAQAAFLLEPFAGMNFNSTAELNGTDADVTGTSVGARIGFQNMGLMLGLDARRNSWNFETDTTDSDYTLNQLGFFVGYDFPMMLRIWGNYVFSYEGTNDDDSDIKLKEGSGMVFGIGYKVVPFVSLNFEISNLETKKLDNGTSESNYDADYSTYLLSVSFPLSL